MTHSLEVDLKTGNSTKGTPSKKSEPEDTRLEDVYQSRRLKYPCMGDQLEAIWDCILKGELTPKARKCLEQIHGVKERFPKP